MESWNIKQLKQTLIEDLALCTTHNERLNAEAIAGVEIRKLAEKLSAIRKLTPAELAIAEQYGFRN